jgi:hypothetical protein
MAKGRKSGGRTKGTPNKATQKRIEAAVAALDGKITPLEVMLQNMEFAHNKGQEVLEKIMLSNLTEADGSPVDVLKALMNFRGMAQECAKDAAPYVHPKLAAIEHSSDPDNPLFPTRIEVTIVHPKTGSAGKAGAASKASAV